VNSAETFDAYFARCGKFNKLQKLANSVSKSPFVHFSCSCLAYNKGAFSKHSIGLGIMKHVFKVPVECCIENLGAEKKNRTQKKTTDTRFKFEAPPKFSAKQKETNTQIKRIPCFKMHILKTHLSVKFKKQ
jgi:hypothetical protein